MFFKNIYNLSHLSNNKLLIMEQQNSFFRLQKKNSGNGLSDQFVLITILALNSAALKTLIHYVLQPV